MELTQHDFNERTARQDKGEATDEDNRLIALYEREGWERKDDIPTGPDQPGADDVNSENPAGSPGQGAAQGNLDGDGNAGPKAGEPRVHAAPDNTTAPRKATRPKANGSNSR